MPQRRFNFDDQRAFAGLSGDFNPLHLDPVAARRLLFGRPAVHGVNALLWALDQWLAADASVVGIAQLNALFERPIGLEDNIALSVGAGAGGTMRLELRCDGVRATRIDVTAADARYAPVGEIIVGPPPRLPCKERQAEDLAAVAGDLELYLDGDVARRMFPALMIRLPPSQVAVLLATTRLVGMECPGLHSLFTELDIRFGPAEQGSRGLSYRVRRFDRRLATVTMDLTGTGAKGTITAFLRPARQAQPEMTTMTNLVSGGEFAGQRALIIGGSRGLGEVSAKLLAAGGAAVTLTYHRGSDDAARVAGEIAAAGGRALSLPFDALGVDKFVPDMVPDTWRPTDLYYFATPTIFAGAKGAFQPTLFRGFCDYYVTGFMRTLEMFRRPGTGALGIFYPSTIAIDEMPVAMSEYVAAKCAGEGLCQALARHDKLLDVYCPRLPRMATDQTMSVFPVHNAEPAHVMLRHLRQFRDQRETARLHAAAK